MDAELNVRYESRGSLRELKALSVGQRDAVLLSLRLALIDILYKGEKPFLIFDDAFAGLDDSALKNAGALVKRLSEKYQTVYFTCHKSREI